MNPLHCPLLQVKMNNLFFLLIVLTINSNFSYAQVPIDSLMIRLNEVNGKDQVDLLNRYSKKYMYEGIDLSNEFAQQAYRLAEQLVYPAGTGEALLNMGIIAFISGKPERAIQFLDSAYHVSSRLMDVEWQGELYLWMARSYEVLEQFEKSILWYQTYFDIYQSRKDTTNMALALYWQGDLLDRLDRPGEARETYQEAMHYFSGIPNRQGMFITWLKLTGLETEAGFPDRADEYLRQAEALIQYVGQPDLLITYFQVKANHYEQIRPDSALHYWHQALNLASRNKKSFIRLSILREIAVWNKLRGKPEEADRYSREYSSLYDSLFQLSGLSDSATNGYSSSDSIRQDIGAVREDTVPEGENKFYIIMLIAGAVLLIFSFGYFAINLYQLRKEKAISRQMAVLKKEEILTGSETEMNAPCQPTHEEQPEESLRQNFSEFPGDQNEEIQHDHSPATGQALGDSDGRIVSVFESDAADESLQNTPENFTLVLDEKLKINFASKTLREYLNYENETLFGFPIDLLLKEDEIKNEKIFKQIMEILEGNDKEEFTSPIPVVLKSKNGESCSFYTLIAIDEQVSEIFIFLQFYLSYDPRILPEKKGPVYLLSDDLKEYYESQEIGDGKNKPFIFNQYMASIYHWLGEARSILKMDADAFKVGENPLEYVPEVISVVEIYEPIKRILSRKINNRIRFHQEIKNDEIHMLKREWLIVIVYVLLKNAMEAIPGAGDIYFISTVQRDHPVLRIIDTGEGIPHERRNKIFEPFFTTRTGEENYGLGLSIASEIMKHQHGKIRIRSSYGKGTEAVVVFPIDKLLKLKRLDSGDPGKNKNS